MRTATIHGSVFALNSAMRFEEVGSSDSTSAGLRPEMCSSSSA
ncbi:Uncharacterised protein [Mycobacteroides abscessus subsp. abscessus]|nr:Uncharacterised protein [Mycobacteroides abscessus subsp. abscessus]